MERHLVGFIEVALDGFGALFAVLTHLIALRAHEFLGGACAARGDDDGSDCHDVESLTNHKLKPPSPRSRARSVPVCRPCARRTGGAIRTYEPEKNSG